MTITKHIYILIIFSFILIQNTYSDDLSIGLNNQNENFTPEMQKIAGSLVASNLYASYISIELLAQKISNQDFDFKKDKKVLQSLEMISSNLEEVLKTIYVITESKKDAKVIYDLVELTKKISDDAKLLNKFAKSRKSKILDEYNKHHLEAWTALKSYFKKGK